MAETSFKIDGMNCGHCTQAVEDALGGLEGVSTVVADLESGTAVVTHSGNLDEKDVAALIEDLGFVLG